MVDRPRSDKALQTPQRAITQALVQLEPGEIYSNAEQQVNKKTARETRLLHVKMSANAGASCESCRHRPHLSVHVRYAREPAIDANNRLSYVFPPSLTIGELHPMTWRSLIHRIAKDSVAAAAAPWRLESD